MTEEGLNKFKSTGDGVDHQLIVLLGGVRSGKSRFGEQLAQRIGGEQVLYVATAAPGDAEMQARIARHQADRHPAWKLCEIQTDAQPVTAIQERYRVVLIDCLPLFVTNVISTFDESEAMEVVERNCESATLGVLQAAQEIAPVTILITGEVGLGIVPASPLGRMFRDVLGRLNQRVVEMANDAYLMVAGQALDLKSLAVTSEDAAERIANRVDENDDLI